MNCGSHQLKSVYQTIGRTLKSLQMHRVKVSDHIADDDRCAIATATRVLPKHHVHSGKRVTVGSRRCNITIGVYRVLVKRDGYFRIDAVLNNK